MAETKKSRSWPTVGSLRKSDDGRNYIKLANNVTILVDGKPVSMNKSRTINLQDPRKNVEQLQQRGVITGEQAEERLEKLSSMQWLRYELVIPPAKAE